MLAVGGLPPVCIFKSRQYKLSETAVRKITLIAQWHKTGIKAFNGNDLKNELNWQRQEKQKYLTKTNFSTWPAGVAHQWDEPVLTGTEAITAFIGYICAFAAEVQKKEGRQRNSSELKRATVHERDCLWVRERSSVYLSVDLLAPDGPALFPGQLPHISHTSGKHFIQQININWLWLMLSCCLKHSD